MSDEIKEKDIIQKSIECLSNAKLNDTTYEVARDIVLDYITNLQEENERLNNIINELEKTLEEQISNPLSTEFKLFSKMVLNDLKELKEGKKNE